MSPRYCVAGLSQRGLLAAPDRILHHRRARQNPSLGMGGGPLAGGCRGLLALKRAGAGGAVVAVGGGRGGRWSRWAVVAVGGGRGGRWSPGEAYCSSRSIAWKNDEKAMSAVKRIAAMMMEMPMTTQVEPSTSRRLDQLTFFISPSVAMRNSTVRRLT